ncbi:unnamed protein product [Withania somnifera]
MPKVVAEELEPEVDSVDALDENVLEQERENGCSPKSTPNEATDNSGAGDTVIPSNRIFVNGDAFTADGNGDNMVPSCRIFLSGDASIADENDMIQEQRDTTICVRVERSGDVQVVASREDVITQQVQVQVAQTEVIELSDDEEDDEDQKYGEQSTDVNPEIPIWHYLDPQGIIRGPFPLTLLKHWSDVGYYFGPSFSVWKVGQSPLESVLLVDVLRQFFPVQ